MGILLDINTYISKLVFSLNKIKKFKKKYYAKHNNKVWFYRGLESYPA